MNPMLSILLFGLVSGIICFSAGVILSIVLKKLKDRPGVLYDCLCIIPPILGFITSTIIFGCIIESPDEYRDRRLNDVRNTRFECMEEEIQTIDCLQKYQLFLEDSVRVENLYGDARRVRLLKRIELLHESE